MAQRGIVGSVADRKPKPKSGGPSKGKSRELRRDVTQMQDKWDNNYAQLGQQYGGLFGPGAAGTERDNPDLAGAEQFPARLGYRDKYDTMYQLKSTLPNESPLGLKIFTDEDAEYLVRKQEMVNAAAFKQVSLFLSCVCCERPYANTQRSTLDPSLRSLGIKRRRSRS
jgi:hypothetical protein